MGIQKRAASILSVGSPRPSSLRCLGYPGSREASSNTQCLSPGVREERRTWVQLDPEVFVTQAESAHPRRPSQLLQSMKHLVTFEEDKLAVLSLIGSIDGRRQAPPELADRHRIAIHHLVIPHPPEPSLLETRQGGESPSRLVLSFLLQSPKLPHCAQAHGVSSRSFYDYFHPAPLRSVLLSLFFSSLSP